MQNPISRGVLSSSQMKFHNLRIEVQTRKFDENTTIEGLRCSLELKGLACSQIDQEYYLQGYAHCRRPLSGRVDWLLLLAGMESCSQLVWSVVLS